MTRRPLDAELVRRGLAADLAEAEDAVRAGLVSVGGRPAMKTTTLVAAGESLRLAPPASTPFVSRGGVKLRAALDRSGIDPDGLDCLDAGASTGGFTDCLLQAGAARVFAIDVGNGQLAWRLRTDPRVTVRDRTNVRDLGLQDLPFHPDLAVADLSFVSLRSVVPGLVELLGSRTRFIVLIKPQFEIPHAEIPAGGVVRDADGWRRAIEGVAEVFEGSGTPVGGMIASPVTGTAGNVEFLMWTAGDGSGLPIDVEAALEEGRRVIGS